MPDSSLYSELPRRPAWAALAGPIGMLAGTVAAIFLGRLLEATVGPTAMVSGLVMLVVSGGAVATAIWIAGRTGGGEPWQLGLERLDLRSTFAWAALVTLPALALAWAALAGTDAAAAFDVPVQLLAPGPEAAFGVPRPDVGFNATVVAIALAVCVGPAVATELVLRGLAMPALTPSIGRVGAAVVAALLTPAPFALLADRDLGGPILAAALLAGLGNSLVYLRTADLYPGIAALALALGLALGASLGWSAAGVAALAISSSLLALGAARALVAGWPTAFEGRHWGASPTRP